MTWRRFLTPGTTLSHRPDVPMSPGGDWASFRRCGIDAEPPLPNRPHPLRYAVALAALLLAATACSLGSSEESDRATDPKQPADVEPTIPTPVIVMDVDRPELCTGPVAESYPPQCGGPPIREWRWADHEGDYEQVGKVRWGAFVVQGYFDGDEYVVTSATPA